MKRASLAACLLALADPAGAQIALDGSLGPSGALLPDASGDIAIPQEVGLRTGGNLFHSFSEFGIPNGQSATFGASEIGIERVLARVTGGSRSQIDGALRSRIPDADLYLFNPAGILFGNSASVDVDGSLHVGTADSLSLADGGSFRADPQRSVLTSAAPSAWEFTGPAAGSISVRGSRLELNARETLSLVGGPIDVSGRPGVAFGAPVLVAPGGRIELVAVGSPGSVALGTAGPDASSIATLADVRISDNAQLTTAGERSGSVHVRARDVHVDQAFVFSDSLGAEAPLPRAFDFEARGEIAITGPAELVAELDGSADTGALRFTAQRLRMEGAGAIINSWLSQGSGRGGDIEIQVTELVLRAGAQIRSESNGPGQAGHLKIAAERIDLRGLDTWIGAETRTRGADVGRGFAEGVPISVRANRIELSDGAQILSRTSSPGDGADVDVETGSLRISGVAVNSRGQLLPAGIVSNEEAPPAGARSWRVGTRGAVAVRASDSIEIADGGVIQSSSLVREARAGSGGTGAVSVDAPRISLLGSRIVDPGTATSASLQSGISTRATFRDSGDLAVRTDDLEIRDGASLNATTSGPGRGGTIRVQADSLRISGTDARGATAGIFSRSVIAGPGAGTGGGPAGDVELSLRDLTLSNGAAIRVSSETTGNGGRLSLDVPGGRVRISDADLTSEVIARGPGDRVPRRGGDIVIRARELVLDPGAAISARNSAAGPAGSIVIELRDVLRADAAEITTEAIEDGGNITIDPKLVALNRSRILARANTGDGGNITIVADEFLSSADTVIDASSELGIDGDVVIRSPAEDLVEEAAPVSADLLGADDLLRRGCAARRSRSGSLTVAPRVLRIGAAGVLEEGCDAR